MITAILLDVPEIFIYISTSIKDNDNPIECDRKLDVLGRDYEEYIDDSRQETMINSLKQMMLVSVDGRDSWLDDFEDVLILRNLRDRWTLDIEGNSRRLIELRVHTICAQIQFVTALSVVKDNLESLRNIIFFYGNEPEKIKIKDNFYSSCKKAGYEAGFIDQPLNRENMEDTKAKSADELEHDIREGLLPREALSASVIRKLVLNDKIEAFVSLYLPYLEQSKIEMLYRQIKAGLDRPVIVSATKSRAKKGKGIGIGTKRRIKRHKHNKYGRYRDK